LAKGGVWLLFGVMYIATKEHFQSSILFGREGDDGISIKHFLVIDEFVVFRHDGVIE
jgi:hypothetical protein